MGKPFFCLVLMFLLVSLINCGQAATGRLTANGERFPAFCVGEEGEVFYSRAEDPYHPIFSRKVLYRIDLDRLAAEMVFQVKDGNSQIYAYAKEKSVYFNCPDGILDLNLTYGSHVWYTAPLDSYEINRENWQKITESNKDNWKQYFVAGEGVYCATSTNDGKPYGKLELFSDGEYTTLLEAEDLTLIEGYEHVVFISSQEADDQTRSFYDLVGRRVVTVPYNGVGYPDVIVSGNNLYYTNGEEVVYKNLFDGITENFVVSMKDTRAMSVGLCCDGNDLFVIEYLETNAVKINRVSMQTNSITETIEVNNVTNYPEFIVVNNLFLFEVDEGIVVTDLNTGVQHVISIE